MTDGAGLLAAIVAAPTDDLPRLVYADWLEEQGDPERAELIRLQCAGTDPRRARRLLRENRARWRIPGLAGLQEFTRGFVERVEATAEALLAAPAGAFDGVPVRAVRVVNADRFVTALAPLPLWRTVERLVLNNNNMGANRRMTQLFGAGELWPRLTSLSMRNNRLWAETLGELATLPITPRLMQLDVSGNPITDGGAELLATEPAFAGLTDLVLRSDELPFHYCIHTAGVVALAESRSLHRLRRLNLAGQAIGETGFMSLVERPQRQGLEELDVSHNWPDELGVSSLEALAATAGLARLRRLILAGNPLPDEAVAALVRWPRLSQLELFDVTGCVLSPEAWNQLHRVLGDRVRWDGR